MNSNRPDTPAAESGPPEVEQLEPGQWKVRGLILADRLPHDEAVAILDCRISPLGAAQWTPEDSPAMGFQPAPGGLKVAIIRGFPSRARFEAYHGIETIVAADDERTAREVALNRFQEIAGLLVLSSQFPIGHKPLIAAPEALLAVTGVWGGGPIFGQLSQEHFGALPVGLPTTDNRQAAGVIAHLSGTVPELRLVLRNLYRVDEMSFLAFSEEHEKHTVVEYMKLVEQVTQYGATVIKKQRGFKQDLTARQTSIITALKASLIEASDSDAVRAIKDAARDLDAANLESAWRRVQAMGKEFNLSQVALEQAAVAWRLRSSKASHPGGGAWPSDARVTARQVAVLFITAFLGWLYQRESGQRT